MIFNFLWKKIRNVCFVNGQLSRKTLHWWYGLTAPRQATVSAEPVISKADISQVDILQNMNKMESPFDFEELLSPHFRLRELTKVSRPEYQQLNNDNLTHITYEALKVLCQTLLEPIRERFGVVIILSGFRWSVYNHQIGGVALSQHTYGESADFYAEYAGLGTVMRWVINSGLKFGQLIWETPQRQTNWIHISLGIPYREEEKCGQILKTNDRKTYFRIDKNLHRI